MRLRDARLCLDCEELHTEDQCPLCASEAFSFVTRWIPSNDSTRDDHGDRKPAADPPPAERTPGARGLVIA